MRSTSMLALSFFPPLHIISVATSFTGSGLVPYARRLVPKCSHQVPTKAPILTNHARHFKTAISQNLHVALSYTTIVHVYYCLSYGSWLFVIYSYKHIITSLCIRISGPILNKCGILLVFMFCRYFEVPTVGRQGETGICGYQSTLSFSSRWYSQFLPSVVNFLNSARRVYRIRVTKLPCNTNF